MTDFTIATFNVKNLIGPDAEYYRFEQYTPEEYAWKRDWLADQMLSMNADIVCLQEVFDRESLADVLRETNKRAETLNKAVIPDPKERYARKAIFRKTMASRGSAVRALRSSRVLALPKSQR